MAASFAVHMSALMAVYVSQPRQKNRAYGHALYDADTLVGFMTGLSASVSVDGLGISPAQTLA